MTEMSIGYRVKLSASNLYWWCIISCGAILLLLGTINIVKSDNRTLLVLLISLALMSTAVRPSTKTVAGKRGFAFMVYTVVAFASIPHFSPTVAAFITAIASIFMWVWKGKDTSWRGSYRQLFFNASNESISMAFAGYLYLALVNSVGEAIPITVLVWLIAALSFVIVNVSILIGMLKIQNKITLVHVWQDMAWSFLLGYIVYAVGGGILTYAIFEYDWIGITIFFFPLILSSLAFQLYTNRIQAYVDNLEAIVEERTQELSEHRDQLAQLNEEKNAFLAVLTHDMKSPLTTIGLYTAVIRKQPHLIEQKPHYLDHIDESQKMLQQLVENILDLGKLEAGQALTLELEPFNLHDLVALTADQHQKIAERKNISLQFTAETETAIVNADRFQLQRIFTNLITNAIKYTPESGIVRVSLLCVNDEVVVSVQDTGYGISPEQLPHIFNRYHRVFEHKSRAKGAGLGLSIVDAITNAHNAQINVVSEVGVGSTFTICLKRYVNENDAPYHRNAVCTND